tara:strand:- start:2037 stop:3692 length:1656 start_codon:yes stop_codon:yes gene_type:complete
MDKQGRSLSETVWTRLDRKAGAITELTVRQLRHRISTWVVLGVGMLMIMMLSAFYVDAVRDGFEPIDNDGDSEDWDGDGYPLGQERKFGTSDWDPEQYPGSGSYVQDGSIEWGDDIRTHTGNHTWEYVTGIFTPIWIDESYQGDRWSMILDFDSVNFCEEENDASEFMNSWSVGWGGGCEFENGDYAFQEVRFRGEGTLRVPRGHYAGWGHMTDVFDVEPEPASNYINEDDLDWNGNALQSQGFDDDGDCLRDDWNLGPESDFWFDKDDNNNGRDCDVIYVLGVDGVTVVNIIADENVDEDPDDEKLLGESNHRGFIVAVGKIAFVMILSIFLPLFLALGLVRDETENGTLHYLLSKPIHRGEFITYRILGYLLISGTFVFLMSLIMASVTSLLGPGDSIIRFGDIVVWVGIAFATILALTAYGALFNTLGLISSRYGVYIALVIGIYEFVMAVMTLSGATLVPVLSISHWTLQLVDSIVLIVWDDTLFMDMMSNAFGYDTILGFFWSPPAHTLGTENPYVSAIISVIVLIFITVSMIFFAQSLFKRREIM